MTTRLKPKQSSPHRRWESLHVRKITSCAIFSLQASPGQSVKAAIPKQTASLDSILRFYLLKNHLTAALTVGTARAPND